MNDPPAPPALASVLYLRLDGFARLPVVEQTRQRADLEIALAGALQGLAPEERLVLDGPDGLAVVILGNPAGALASGEACRAAALPLAVGLNHGPIALAGADAERGLIGDGLHAARVAAGRAGPGELLATRAFRDALDTQAPPQARALRPAGIFADASVRTHELFQADTGAPARRRRRLLAVGFAGALLLTAGGALLRGHVPSLHLLSPPATLRFDVAPGGEVFVDGQPRGSIPALGELTLAAGRHALEIRHGVAAPLTLELELEPGQQMVVRHRFPPPAVLTFDVAPGGEVFVDGRPRGSVATLQRLELAAGRHHLEIRHDTFPAYVQDLDLHAAEARVIRHRFLPPGALVFDIRPGGEVFVDGQARGTVPPLTRLDLPAGRHRLEVRSGRYAPLRITVNVDPGEEIVVRHRFGENQPAELFGKLKKKLGFD